MKTTKQQITVTITSADGSATVSKRQINILSTYSQPVRKKRKASPEFKEQIKQLFKN